MKTSTLTSELAEGFRNTWKNDILAGFLVFLIALPLCLGISMASGFPPVSGIFTAIIGGLIVSFFKASNLAIKGPAAGLIVIALGAVEELGKGDAFLGYKLALACIVIAGLLQIVFGLVKSGVLADFFPSAAVHGMLAAIGIIIASKQIHTLLGVKPAGKEILDLIMEIPTSIMNMNPEVAIIGALSLVILFGLPLIKHPFIKRIPPPMVVLLLAIPLGQLFDLTHEHTYLFLNNHEYTIGPKFLVTLPSSLLSAVTMPNFSQAFSGTSIKYIVMFALVGSLESLLSSKAVDTLDPWHRKSNMNRDLVGVGVGNTLAGMIGGLPMISEIVRSSANINNGARTWWSNVFHGAFLLIFVAFFPALIHQIPLAALAAMLIYTGVRLASPKEFYATYKIGKEQLLIFVTTIVVTLATDLLVGIATGIIVKFIMHFVNGLPAKYMFKPLFTVTKNQETYTVEVFHSAVFSNYIKFKKSLDALPRGANIIIDFSNTTLVDHTVMENLHRYQHEYELQNGTFTCVGFTHHEPFSQHALAARKKKRTAIPTAIVFLCILILGTVEQSKAVDGALVLPLKSDTSTYLKATVMAQVWGRYSDNNPGSTLYNYNLPTTYDIGLRRVRMQLFGKIAPQVFFYTQIGINNFNDVSARKTPIFFHDVVAEFQPTDRVVHFGMGLTGWTGYARFSSPSVTTFMGYDAPLFEQTTNDANDQFLRKLSMYAKGKVGNLDYRLVVSHPFAIQNSSIVGPLSTHTEYSAKPANLQTSGYFSYEFFDNESNVIPYTVGTYLGKKTVVNLGAGFQHQQGAFWRTQQAANGVDTVYEDMNNYAVDMFLDMPVGNDGAAVSSYLVAAHTGMGNDYLRSSGVMNPANGITGATIISGAGNAMPSLGTGTVLFGQLGYLLPTSVLGTSAGRIMPYIMYSHSQFVRLKEAVQFFDLGVQYFFNGHQSKVALDYQNRPVFDTTSLLVAEHKSQVVLMFQTAIL